MNHTLLASILSGVDRVLFRLLPGGFFLWYVFDLVRFLEVELLSFGFERWVSPLYTVALLFVFTSFWWILFPSAFDLRKKQTVDPKEALLVHTVILVINLLSLVFFVPSSGFVEFFVRLGVSLYGVILFSDFLFLCFSVVSELSQPKRSGLLSFKSGIGVLLFFVIALGIPAFGVLFLFIQKIAEVTLAWPVLISLLVSLLFQVVVRLMHQVQSS